MLPQPVFSISYGTAIVIAVLLSVSPLYAVLRHPDMTDAQAIALGELPQFKSRAIGAGCSAALISPEWALTAAHCIGYQAERRVRLGYKLNGQTYTVEATAYRVTLDEPGLDDVALIHLDEPIPQAVTYTAPYDRFDEFNQLGWKVGHGWHGVLGDPIRTGGFRGMTQIINSSIRENRGNSSITPQLLFYNYNGSPEVANPNPLTTRYEGGTGPGDSGGPLYVYSRGRFFNAAVVSGPDNGDYRDGRVSTHLPGILARTGLSFAYPQALELKAVWSAEALASQQAGGSVVADWSDEMGALDWTNAAHGGQGQPVLIADGTPTGLAAVRFDGDDALGLAAQDNPLADTTAFSIAMVVRASGPGAGLQTNAFGTMGVLDASSGGDDGRWGVSFSNNEQYGLSVEEQGGAVSSIFRGGQDNASLHDGQWHVLVASWDGSEIPFDNAGDDLNMKLYIDTVDQMRAIQGPSHINVARDAVSVLLGKSQTNAQNGFSGDIAEVRLYTGELQRHEVDRLLQSLRARYIDGELGVVFERPWTDRLALPAGHSLRTQGILAGGGTGMEWGVVSGPAPVTFSDAFSPDTDIEFAVPGDYHLRATVTDGNTTGTSDLWVRVYIPDMLSTVQDRFTARGSWLGSDIGKLDLAGGFSETNGTFTINAAGDGVGLEEGETYDQGHLVWKAVAGDFDLVARLDAISSNHNTVRAGIMLRGGPGPTDAAAFIGYRPDGTVYLLTRQDGGYWGNLTTDSVAGISLPAYLKLERRGSQITAYLSQDGLGYTAFGDAAEVALPGIVRAGLFAARGDAAGIVTAQFSEVQLEQVGYALASTAEVLNDNSAGVTFEYDPEITGADEPWLRITTPSAPQPLLFSRTYNVRRQVLRAQAESSGDYRTRLSIDDGNAVTFIERVRTISYNTRFDFDQDGDTEGWSGTNVVGLQVSEGVISATASTNDPFLSLTGLSLNGSQYHKVKIRVKVPFNMAIRLFWGNTDTPGFAASRAQDVSYTADGEYQTITFDMAGVEHWDGQTIAGLRIDPQGNGISGQAFEFDFIEISDGVSNAAGPPQFDFKEGANFAAWSLTKDIASAYVAGGALNGTATGGDPILTNDVEDFSAQGIDSLLVRVRSDVNGRLDFFWATSDAPGFAAARRLQADYTGNGEWQLLRLPLAGNPDWDGKTITHLRLDPTNRSGAVFNLDAIVFSTGDADNDMLPDQYEIANGLDPLQAADAQDDNDHDRFNNLAEYVAGTDPLNPADFLHGDLLPQSGGGYEIRLDGVTGRTYGLMFKQDLRDATWQIMDTDGPLLNDRTVTLRDDAMRDKAFYQVEVSLP